MKTCPNCNELLGNDVRRCFKCRYDFTLGHVVSKVDANEEKKKREQRLLEKHKQEQVFQKELSELSELPFLCTTGYGFDGCVICRYMGILSSESVLGTAIFSEIDASISDTFGTNSKSMEGKLSLAKRDALLKLQKKAMDAGANSIIGIRFNIMTLASNMMVVSVDGTAVIRKEIK